MTTDKYPITPAVRLLKSQKVDFGPCLYNYEERGGTEVSARELAVDEHLVIKTLIMETESKHPLIVLMHGDRQVSTKQLAREMQVKTISPCTPEVAHRHTGYLVGGTSPFATRKVMPVFVQKTILDFETIYINGGKRGFLVRIASHRLLELLKPRIVEISA